MRRGMVRVVTLMAVCGLLVWSTESQSESQEQPQPSRTQNTTPGEQQRTAPPPIIVNVLPAQKTEEEAAQEHQEREEKAKLDRRTVDLTAELAHFTAGLYYATVVLAVATVLLVFATGGLGYFAYRQARDMKIFVAATEKTARAAEKSADTAEDAFTKLERPYVFLFGVRALEQEDGFPLVKFSIANYGKTPAIIENFRALASIGSEPETPLRVDDPHPLFSSPIISAQERRGDLQQGVDIPYRSPELFHAPPSQIIPRLDDPKNDLFLWIIANYRGPFTGGHETSACWRYDRDSDRFVQYGHQDYNYIT